MNCEDGSPQFVTFLRLLLVRSNLAEDCQLTTTTAGRQRLRSSNVTACEV